MYRTRAVHLCHLRAHLPTGWILCCKYDFLLAIASKVPETSAMYFASPPKPIAHRNGMVS